MNEEGFFDVAARLTAKKATARAPAPPTSAKPLTVTQLTAIIEGAIKAGLPASVAVRGEISNANLHRASGHLYFTMKDAGACIDCVMFRDAVEKLKFTVADGIEMLAGGRVGVYAGRGKYQLYASTLQPMGQGALELAFRQLHAKLTAEGLFAPERKKPIPSYPARIALVTSQSTAALQDMLKVLRRFRWLRLMLFHVPVQGEGSAPKIASAIACLNQNSPAIGGIDAILLARGGGSLEDLWAFNEESVARAIAASAIPIVTGIGHEVDCSIADLVADYHAHTPTEAAQVITAHWRQAADAIDVLALGLNRSIAQSVANARHRLTAVQRHELFRRPTDRINSLRQLLDDKQRALMLAMTRRLGVLRASLVELDGRLQARGPAVTIRQHREKLAHTDTRLSMAIHERLRVGEARLARAQASIQECHPRHLTRLARQRLASLQTRLALTMRQSLKNTAGLLDTRERELRALGPEQVLKRGYTITRLKKAGVIVRSVQQIKTGDRLITRTADGETESIAEDRQQLPLFE